MLFKYYPLEFSAIEEAMIEIDAEVMNGKRYIIRKLYPVLNENVDYDDEQRYDSIPFFAKRVAKEDYPDIEEFVDWIELFGDLYEESRLKNK